MRTKTKALTLALCAVLLVVTTIFATMAYLTSQASVTNTFTVGKVAITLDEAKVNIYGEQLDPEERVVGNEYKLIPGHTYHKDPTVHVAAGSEEAYIRMLVTITDFDDVKKAFGKDFLPQNFVVGWNNSIWETTTEVIEEADTATYEFRYKETVSTVDLSEKTLEPLFTHIIVPGDIDNDTLATLGEMKIEIVAHAIQADGFEDADKAWKAWEPTNN